MPEIVKNQENGYLIDTIDYKKLANKILEIINLPKDKLNGIRKNAIETSKNFTLDNTINNLNEVYVKLSNEM